MLLSPKLENVNDGFKVKEEVEFGEEREQKVKEKVEYGEEGMEQKCFKLEDSEDEYDEMNRNVGVNATDENVRDVIAGNANINFKQFKRLMEQGRLKKEDLAMMRNAKVVKVPGEAEVVQFLASSLKDFNKINLKELTLNDVAVVQFLNDVAVSSRWKREVFVQLQAGHWGFIEYRPQKENPNIDQISTTQHFIHQISTAKVT